MPAVGYDVDSLTSSDDHTDREIGKSMYSWRRQ